MRDYQSFFVYFFLHHAYFYLPLICSHIFCTNLECDSCSLTKSKYVFYNIYRYVRPLTIDSSFSSLPLLLLHESKFGQWINMFTLSRTRLQTWTSWLCKCILYFFILLIWLHGLIYAMSNKNSLRYVRHIHQIDGYAYVLITSNNCLFIIHIHHEKNT